jgi:aspartate/methionine/tyrosine aminotransferase
MACILARRGVIVILLLFLLLSAARARMRVVSPCRNRCLGALASLSASTRSGSKAISTSFRRFASPSSDESSSSVSSKRGRRAVGLLPSYLADARDVTKYSLETPQGALQLGVAESLMLEDWLVPALNHQRPIPADAIYYQPTAGRQDFREAMGGYIEGLMGLPNGRLEVDGLVLGAGCNAVLENLCITLAEAGESVLIPTPYYAAFEFDLAARAGLNVVPVTTQAYQSKKGEPQSMYYPNTAALDAAYERALEAGSFPRILLISHPNNPLGISYPESVVQECIDWCRARQVHLISDEIYAGSIFRTSGFRSALQLADSASGFGPYIHWVYALSKDFALSGLRVGAAYTENEEIRLPLQKLNDLCQVCTLMNCDFLRTPAVVHIGSYLVGHICAAKSTHTSYLRPSFMMSCFLWTIDFIHDAVVDQGNDGTQAHK